MRRAELREEVGHLERGAHGLRALVHTDLGLSTIRILTNNPRKVTGIEGFGLRVVDQLPIETEPNHENARYLATKREKLGHKLHHQDVRFDPDPEAA